MLAQLISFSHFTFLLEKTDLDLGIKVEVVFSEKEMDCIFRYSIHLVLGLYYFNRSFL